MFPPTVTVDNSFWYRGTADALYQNLDFLKNCHEPYVVIASGDGVYKLDFNKVLEYHIAKKADITVVCKDLPPEEDVTRFGVLKMNEDCRIERFEEKPMAAISSTISCGIYVVRRRQLIELIERCGQEGRFDFVKDGKFNNLYTFDNNKLYVVDVDEKTVRAMAISDSAQLTINFVSKGDNKYAADLYGTEYNIVFNDDTVELTTNSDNEDDKTLVGTYKKESSLTIKDAIKAFFND